MNVKDYIYSRVEMFLQSLKSKVEIILKTVNINVINKYKLRYPVMLVRGRHVRQRYMLMHI